MKGPVVTLLVLLVTVVAPALAAGPPPDPTNPAECVLGGGECLPSSACPGWQQPFKGICGAGRECCFKDFQNHRLRCGLFGGDCAKASSCGNAPRRPNAYCERPGDVCCIWLF